MTAVQKVAVIGAGIAGLATAIRLADAGVAVDLIESQPELTALGSGISLQSNALQAFATLGVWDEAAAAGYAFDGLTLRAPGPDAPVIARRAEGAPDAEEPASAAEQRTAGGLPSAMGMPRPALARILLDRAEAAGVRTRFGIRVSGTQERGQLVAVFSGDVEVGEYDLVIGADGLHSAVRAGLGIEAGPEPTGMGIWRAFVSRPAEVQTTELYYGGPAYIAGYTPTGENSMYAFLVFDAEKHFDMSAPDAARFMVERSRAYGGPWDAIRADLEAGAAAVNYTWFTQHVLPAPWNRGRVVLIGDAAHSCPPTIAQGAAQSLEDALVLTELLVTRAAVDAELWDEFHRRRVARATAVVDASVQLAEWQRDGQDHSADMPRLIGELAQRLAERV
ncbi:MULTISPECIES: FAD-dependent oxidoreductase [unclassified Microbacterium]|uniref:FAD-dependent oxidoreductase n=1 Tax=unclassified Microbacterium TaxID=2609290 RepID=UPI00214AB18F|nr:MULTISPECIES: FAD-dependent oxidoreductase [unclassified Microbacterium]MCR2810928.1 FAD-dependent oxidoreductase [Microbacterium sp. zg.B185]WIM19672.1 FAD-dependent oxidoreductase [Microbacterium sp. zg-B185]